MRINLFLSDCHQAVSQHLSGHSLLKIRPFSTCSKWFSHTIGICYVHRSLDHEMSYLLLSAKCLGWPGCEPLLSWVGALYSHSHLTSLDPVKDWESRRRGPFLRSRNGFQNLSCSNRSLQKLQKGSIWISLSQAYLPGMEVNHDHEGASSRERPFHCTSVWLLVGDCVRAIPWWS
jgi:hypothetical protein